MLGRHTDVNLTILASGIQLLPNRPLTPLEEAFSSDNKSLLYDILNKHSPRAYLLLSGDVHFAQLYRAPTCSGHNYVYELTSSGMTHTAWSQFNCPTPLLSLVTPDFYAASPIVNDLNFGLIKVSGDNV